MSRLLALLDTFHRVVVEAEVVADLVDNRVEDEFGHLVVVVAVLLDRPLIDVNRIGKDIAVRGIAPGQIGTAVETVEGIGRLDAELLERLVIRPVLDHHGDVGDPVLELAGQPAQGPFDEGLELRVRHNPRTRSTFMTSLTSRIACMMPWSWWGSSPSMTKGWWPC